MTTVIAIRSTAKNWIVSVNRTNANGVTAKAPLATMPRRAYAACALAALVTSAQKTFFADGVEITTDIIGVELLASLGIIDTQVAAEAAAKVEAATDDFNYVGSRHHY